MQDREQTWLDLNLADASTGRAHRLLRETTTAWVNENGNPVWLKDGSFLWFSERSGFKHLYRYSASGELVKQVTTGRWEVRTLFGVDENNGVVYFSSPERNPIATDIYRIRLDGTGMTRLSQGGGTNRAIFNPDFTLLRWRLEQRHDADTGAAASSLMARRSASSTATRCLPSPSSSRQHPSSCRSRHATVS